VGFIHVDKVKSFSPNQAANGACSPAAQAETRHLVNCDSSFCSAIRERRILRRQQFDLVPALPQSPQR
jgi:hypothetical protein